GLRNRRPGIRQHSATRLASVQCRSLSRLRASLHQPPAYSRVDREVLPQLVRTTRNPYFKSAITVAGAISPAVPPALPSAAGAAVAWKGPAAGFRLRRWILSSTNAPTRLECDRA